MYFYLPVDLDLSGHYAQNPTFDGFKKDKMNLILHTIFTIPVTNKHLDIVDGFVPLSAAVLQEQMKDYKKYLDYGLATGMLATDGLYIKGFKCKGYKIILPYGKDFQSVPIHDYKLRRTVQQHYQKICKSTKGYEFLNKWFTGLELDTHGALSFLREEYQLKNDCTELRDYKMVYDIRMLNLNGKNGGYQKVVKDPKIQYQQGVLSINRLLDGKYSYHVDDTVGRYHSVLTNMRSPLRNFLTYKGSPLVSIDIKNSQPYLLCLLLQSSFWDSEKIRRSDKVVFKKQKPKNTILNLKPRTSNTISSTISLNSSSSLLDSSITTLYSVILPLCIDDFTLVNSIDYFMLGEIKRILAVSSFDDYIEKVTSGLLYDSLQPAFEQVLGYSIADRQELKKAVFQVLFTPNQFIGQDHAAPKRIFRECYPEVYALCNVIKKKEIIKITAKGKDRDKAKKGILLPLLLQRIESHIMLHVVAKRLQKNYPKVPIFTIHDSIMTTEEHQELVARVMEEELYRCIGYRPTLDVTLLTPAESIEKLERMRERRSA